ncbi:MAG: hypothetical protein QOF53_2529 [Nocardioidaceae bacterium]|jgi:hypothetical protein|nr:hypothetical protein [Nocardioidaceae bacterium]
MNPITTNPAVAVMYAHQQQAEIALRTELLRNARLATNRRAPGISPRRRRPRVRRWAYALRLRVAPR